MNSINKSKNIFTVIDVGNSKVSCLIGTPVRTNCPITTLLNIFGSAIFYLPNKSFNLIIPSLTNGGDIL